MSSGKRYSRHYGPSRPSPSPSVPPSTPPSSPNTSETSPSSPSPSPASSPPPSSPRTNKKTRRTSSSSDRSRRGSIPSVPSPLRREVTPPGTVVSSSSSPPTDARRLYTAKSSEAESEIKFGIAMPSARHPVGSSSSASGPQLSAAAAPPLPLPAPHNGHRRSTLHNVFLESGELGTVLDKRGSILSAGDEDPIQLEYEERHWMSFVTALFAIRGTVFTYIVPQILFAGLVGLGVSWWYTKNEHIAVSADAHLISGALMALLLVFRNNTSFERYSEARRLLGQIKGGMRTVVSICHAVPADGFGTANDGELNGVKAELKEVCKTLQVLFAAMIVDVRDTREEREDPSVGPAAIPNAAAMKHNIRSVVRKIIDSRQRNDAWLYRRYSPAVRPTIVAQSVVRMVCQLQENGVLKDVYAAQAVDAVNRVILPAWDGLVQIVTTPTPFPYRHLVGSLVFCFIMTLPFGLVNMFGWLTGPAVAMIAGSYYGVMRLALELENPLGWDINDVDMTGFSGTVAEETFAVHASTFGVPEECPGGALSRNDPNIERTERSFAWAVKAVLGRTGLADDDDDDGEVGDELRMGGRMGRGSVSSVVSVGSQGGGKAPRLFGAGGHHPGAAGRRRSDCMPIAEEGSVDLDDDSMMMVGDLDDLEGLEMEVNSSPLPSAV